jgi:hypothetical protein
MALFLFSVFMMFAIFSLVGGPFALNGGNVYGVGTSVADQCLAAEQGFREAQAAARDRIVSLQAQRIGRLASGHDPALIDAHIRSAEEGAALQRRIFTQTMALIAAEEQRQRSAAHAPGQAANGDEVERPDADEQPTNIDWLNQAWRDAKRNPELLLFRLQTNAYKFSWALIPISVPFLWLLFLHRRRYRRYKAYDHTVFVTYSIAFMSLGLIVLSLLRPLGVGEIFMGFAITLVPPIHIYRQLRGAYSLSRLSALWRTAALLAIALIAAILFFVLLVLLGALE